MDIGIAIVLASIWLMPSVALASKSVTSLGFYTAVAVAGTATYFLVQ